MKQFGVTETYDPCYVADWDEKLLETNIIITKELTDDMIHKVIGNVDKIILHHTVTGQGGTWIEPGVNSYNKEFKQFKKLISMGYPAYQYVLRLDPIIPFNKQCIDNIQDVLNKWNSYAKKIKYAIRCRISIIDLYKHVIDRINDAGESVPWTSFHAPDKVFTFVEGLLAGHDNLIFESCAEDKFNPEIVLPTSCVSSKDLLILDRDTTEYGFPGEKQRPLCGCLAKKQILGVKPGRCPHNCIYCYWK